MGYVNGNNDTNMGANGFEIFKILNFERNRNREQ